MSITIELPPEVEARLAAEARERGFPLATYVQSLLVEPSCPRLPEPKRLSREEFQASLDRMAKYSDKIPALPIQAFFREALYDDHD